MLEIGTRASTGVFFAGSEQTGSQSILILEDLL